MHLGATYGISFRDTAVKPQASIAPSSPTTIFRTVYLPQTSAPTPVFTAGARELASKSGPSHMFDPSGLTTFFPAPAPAEPEPASYTAPPVTVEAARPAFDWRMLVIIAAVAGVLIFASRERKRQ